MTLPLPLLARTALLALGVACGALAATANTAIEPVPRNAAWMQTHERFVALAKTGGIDLLFLGDSITDFWRTRGKDVWEANFAPLHAANFGINGDRTQHVLWRIANGELEGLHPKVVVLLIGTNNTGLERDTKAPRNTTAETIQGVTLVVHTLLTRLPATKILLLGLFPRADSIATPSQIGEVNAALAKMDDGKIVRYLDLGPQLLGPDGAVSKEIQPDLLHPSPRGYEIWAAAMKAPLADMMNDVPKAAASTPTAPARNP